MRILLDESVPVQVRKAVEDHSVSTAVEMGWRGIGNAELLDRAEAGGFELVIVADKNISRTWQSVASPYLSFGRIIGQRSSSILFESTIEWNQSHVVNTSSWKKKANKHANWLERSQRSAIIRVPPSLPCFPGKPDG